MLTVSTSPGRAGRGHALYPRAPITPPASGAHHAARAGHAVDEEARGHRRRVPAARRQTAEQGRGRGRLVEVERLQVVLAREGLDPGLVDRVRPAREALPDREVVEVEAFLALRHRSLRPA